MKVGYIYSNGLLKFNFHAEEDSGKAKMARKTCKFYLPGDWTLKSVHPDLLALATILIVYPFCGSKITLPFGVSQLFHNTFRQITKKIIYPINKDLKPRISPKLSKPALAYSGGVDSTAALTLLPQNTQLFFLDRIIPHDMPQNSRYNKQSAHFACHSLRKLGKSVHLIKSDFEYVRNPVGFPIDVACAIPGLLLADYLRLDSMAFGTVMESAYRVGHLEYKDYSETHHYNTWGKLFQIVDMPFNQVVAGISEVGTSKIVLNSPYKALAQSCIRGNLNNPCLNCNKCFRKQLLNSTLSGETLNDKFLSRLFLIPEAGKYISKLPIKHENVLTYITAHYQGNFHIMKLLKKKTRGDLLDVSWMEKWYSPSLLLLPEKYRDYVKNRILESLEVMTPQDEKNVKSWNLIKSSASPKYKKYNEQFITALNNHKKNKPRKNPGK